MDGVKLLKEEINQTTESEHDFAKWKLIVVAALGAAGLGLGKDAPGDRYWLLIFIPFVCAYIDLHSYQYQTKIMVIARYIRERGIEDTVLQEYEYMAQVFREKDVFYLGQYANLCASVILTLVAAGIAHYKGVLGDLAAILMWVAGFALIVGLWIWRGRVINGVNKTEVRFPEKASTWSWGN